MKLTPLLTVRECEALLAARRAGVVTVECSFDLGRSVSVVAVGEHEWTWGGRTFPYPTSCKPRTIYYWPGAGFEPAARYTSALCKLVPTEWGPPTFEIDGIKMLPTAKVSPYADAGRKVALIKPLGKVILDTCGGLGYFAAWCLQAGAARVLSFEKHADVIWLRSLNPWSPDSPWAPDADTALQLTHGDITAEVARIADGAVDAILHDPPRFSIAGELYSQEFYHQLARVLRQGGSLFHYTGAPNSVSRGRKLASEVAARLRRAGFAAEFNGDGILASKRGRAGQTS